jgi:hypothetical protein
MLIRPLTIVLALSGLLLSAVGSHSKISLFWAS